MTRTRGTTRASLTVAIAAATLLLTGCSSATPPGETNIEVDTPALQELKADIGVEDCLPGTGSGDLPAVTMECLGGGPSVDLSTLEGPLVINFWASNCPPCVKEMPAIQEFYETHGDQVPVLGIDYLDTAPRAALELARLTGVTYPLLADPGGDLADARGLVVQGLPQFVLLDADGAIVHQEAGGVDSSTEITAMVEEHLGITL